MAGRAARILSIVGTVTLCIVVFIAALLMATYLLTNSGRSLPGGYRPLIVLTGSMEPKLPAGSIVLIKQVAPAEIGVGDIVTFREGAAPDSRLVTHRVYSLTRDEFGNESLVTKGDANQTPDVQPVEPSQVVGKVVLVSASVGRLIRFVRTPVGLVLTILLPAAILIGWEVRDLFRRKKKASHAAGVVALVLSLGLAGAWYPHFTSAGSQSSATGAYFSAVCALEGTVTAGSWETAPQTNLRFLPGTAKAVRPSVVPPGPACFNIASIDSTTGALSLDFGEVHRGNTNNSPDVFRIKNSGDEPIEITIVGAEGFEDFILRVGHGSKGMPVTLEPGEEYSVDIKIGVAHKTPEGDHRGVVRIVVTGVSTTYDIPALITVVDGKGNPKMNQTAPAHENTTEGALGDDTTTTLEGTPADGGVIGSTGQEGQAGEAATTTTVSSATESGPPPAQATQVRPPAQD